jgi:hypothetical protein
MVVAFYLSVAGSEAYRAYIKFLSAFHQHL